MENEQNLNVNDSQVPKEKKKGNKVVVIIISIVILLAAIAGYIYYNNQNKNNNKTPDTNNENTETEASVYKVATWNNVAYKPSKLFFKDEEDNEDYDEIEYYNIATLTTGETVVRASNWFFEDVFIIDKDNNIKWLSNYSSSDEEDLISEISVDDKITIPEIYPKKDITYKGVTLVFSYHGLASDEGAIDETKSIKVGTTEYGDLYEYKNSITDDFYVRRFYIKTNDKKALHYYEVKDIDNIYNDDRTLKAHWEDTNNATITFQMPLSSCGNNGLRLHIEGFTPSKGVGVGTAVNNAPLYKLTDDKLLKVLYDEYYMEDVEGHNISFAQYKTKLTNVVYQDALGEWIILANDSYSHASECGKPVIYLYPEKDTYVNVRVGANITVSDPEYTLGGWRNVLAQPNGNLIYQGKEYNSLFWEGKGHGLYPNVTRIGKVVTQENLLATIKQDLKDQGLNEKEITDFMEFWKDHLPKTPYVKLTWLTTEEMNTLAPLRINPKPETVIRVFLDAKGLYEPIKLVSQNLTKIERKGFTLVEWGGLLNK